MKSLFIAGNWKSNKTLAETKNWLEQFQTEITKLIHRGTVTIVICAPFTALDMLQVRIKNLKIPMSLGAQDISPFAEGSFTGAVNGRQIKELAEWVIVGHSERRQNFGETEDMLRQKVTQAKNVGLKIIYCVSDDATTVPEGIDVVVYEPVWAIGMGKSDTPENANQVIGNIKQKTSAGTVIYGGSVTPENVASFVAQPAVDGVLPGGASLDPIKFSNLIASVVSYQESS